MKLSDAERFWRRVNKTQGCWLWLGELNVKGYSRTRVTRDGKRKWIPAHRVAYSLAGHVIPEGLELDHLCRNRCCVNPEHLEPVTHLENIRRAHRRRDTFVCGHPTSPENVYTRRNGGRMCRICKRMRNVLYKRSVRARMVEA